MKEGEIKDITPLVMKNEIKKTDITFNKTSLVYKNKFRSNSLKAFHKIDKTYNTEKKIDTV